MSDNEESAFAAYKNVKQIKKKAKKTLKLDTSKVNKNGSIVKKKMSDKEDILWDKFVDNIEKSKALSLSTPISPFPKILYKSHFNDTQDTNNVFLTATKPKKKKGKICDISNGNESVDDNISKDVNLTSPNVTAKKVKLASNESKAASKSTKSQSPAENGALTFSTKNSSNKIKQSGLKRNSASLNDSTPKKKKRKTLKTESVIETEQSKRQNILKTNNMAKKVKVDATTIQPTNIASSLSPTKAPKVNIPKDSVEEAKIMLAWILHPISVKNFFEHYWEKKPLHIARENANYFQGIMSCDDLDLALRLCPMYFSKNVNVTAYRKGVRSTEELQGRARPEIVWDFYKKGHSVRVLNPQTFIPNVGKLVYTLQELFQCMVGVNSYLTPAGSQGFAPHYDDIEAFVLQLEGQKHWRVYPPRNDEETLPRYSSPNFSQDEIGEPILEVTLKPGDLLYFPRGWIHQARSVEEHHSLHITVSSYQMNTWADLFEKVIPAALEVAREEDVEFRKGLPINYLNHLGLIHSDSESVDRTTIIAQASRLFCKLLEKCPWDAAADQLGKQFIHCSFPTPVDEPKKGKQEAFNFSPSSKVKLLTANSIRLVSEEGALFVYYNTDNSKEYQGEEPQAFEIPDSAAPALEELIKAYPKTLKIKKLTVPEEGSDEDIHYLLKDLKQRGLLIVS